MSLYSTWGLLIESLNLSLHGVPTAVDPENIKIQMLKITGVVHHIHIWAMATTKNAMTAHIILQKNISDEEVIAIKKR